MQIVKNILIWGLLIAYLVVAMSFVSDRRKKVVCSEIKVFLVDDTENKFVTESEIKELLNKSGSSVMGLKVNEINTKEIEEKIRKNGAIRKAEVYVTVNGDVRVDIAQRNPMFRVVNKKGQSYYIDDEGKKMPLSRKYTAHVLVANGHIIEHFELNRAMDILCDQRDEETPKNYIMCDLFVLSKFICEDEFWRSQIEQIYVNIENEFELVPRVGAHQILFGSIENYDKKFRNLKVFYEKGLNNVGWNNYTKINIKFENQIICTKR
ncbi:MAG: hypothetical protein A2W99_16255 [Bacteroidetes bacterium GWF2_33_16]|nr:MAG: hypothetical protein A2X00_12430 [Bacteroidetes bacterium GWE2_32_14]OFY08570.1 MAG: hypothetical protein A2W99_16255 [Bacteroidetes bacterium GWF2_33_16]